MRNFWFAGMWLLTAAAVHAQPIDPWAREGSIDVDGVTVSMQALRATLIEQAELIRSVAEITGEAVESAGSRGTPPGVARLVQCNGLFGYDTIQSAIDVAQDGDVIVVLPNTCSVLGRWYENIDPRGKRLRIQCADPENPSIVELTVIDGGSAPPEETNQSVVTCRSFEGADTVFNGLTFTNGKGYGITTTQGISTYGGGLYCSGRLPSLWGCRFIGNNADAGGAIFVYSDGSTSLGSGEIRNGLFSANTATSTAGALYLVSSTASSAAKISVSDCRFVNNQAASNAVMYIRCGTSDDTSSPMFSRCLFDGNTSAAGSIVTINSGTGHAISSPMLIDCSFTANTANLGAILYVAAGTGDAMSSPLFSHCNFDGNTVNSGGLVVVSAGTGDSICAPRFDACRFADNTLRMQSNMVRVTSGTGDAIARPVFQSCRFEGNVIDSGRMIQVDSGAARSLAELTLRSCVIGGNTANKGFLYVRAGGNTAAAYADIDGCTIVNNICDAGSMVDLRSGSPLNPSDVSIRNSILWGNRVGAGLEEIQLDDEDVRLAIDDSDLEFLDQIPVSPLIKLGEGNFSLLPEFIDPGGIDDAGTPGDLTDDFAIPGDYHLLVTSPCIDAGDPDYETSDDDIDVDGDPRVLTCRLDVGADEFDPTENPADFTADGLVTIDDLPAFIQALTEGSAGCSIASGDTNDDGRLDGLDISGFVAALID
ncbi:MAG: hypothetical protein H6819_04630 [Phycisphaerales bacterium]|nr:hypothetical protein [Phycisphaerales bacterium]MCB9856486.1 hypothetical protein [Phycisphaerales bacterium]MCB9863967.1 hypothetical protein [Phycisphaerales bacterium]